MTVTDKVRKKSPMTISKTIKINKEIENDIKNFEEQFPGVDLPKLYRIGLYLAMDAVKAEGN